MFEIDAESEHAARVQAFEAADNCLEETHDTFQRCRKRDQLYGRIHSANDGNRTLCGLPMDERWWILTTDGKHAPECDQCAVYGLTESSK